MSKSDEKKPEEKLSLTPEQLKEMMESVTKTAVQAAISALKGPEKGPDQTSDQLMAKATAGMTPEEAEAFRASFGGGKCPSCGQPSRKGQYACKGKHAMQVVYPTDPYWGKWFQGCRLNGALYLSNDPGHAICVPAENNFASDIAEWVNMERTNAQGRSRTHNSGAIGGNGNTSGYRPYNGPGWR